MTLEGILLAIALVGTALVALVVVRWSGRAGPRCPTCGSRKYGLVSKEPLGVRQNDHSAGGHGGGLWAVTVTYKLS